MPAYPSYTWRDSARSPFRRLDMESQHMLFLHTDGIPPPPGRTAEEWQAGFCPWCQLWLRRCHWMGPCAGAPAPGEPRPRCGGGSSRGGAAAAAGGGRAPLRPRGAKHIVSVLESIFRYNIVCCSMKLIVLYKRFVLFYSRISRNIF